MDGAADPSGVDAASWKRLCTSFKGASTDLCESLAATARRICTCYVDPRGLSAFVACRLIALDKCPRLSPIGIGETIRRLIGRAIARVLSDDIQAAADRFSCVPVTNQAVSLLSMLCDKCLNPQRQRPSF